ncbi:MAG: EXORDIUM family protein [Conexibacteraceae bacterium]|nr:EXORDIUM family protein [Conexibacteraceae bacterium]
MRSWTERAEEVTYRRGFVIRMAGFAIAAAMTFALAGATARAIEPQACSSCQPPMAYNNGAVLMATSAGLTVTPIYWAPSGTNYAFPSGFEPIVDGYIANVAAASGSTSNVYSIDTEYYDMSGGSKTSIVYRIQAGPKIVDSGAFPSNGCTPASGYTVCITDKQLQSELQRLTNRRGLTTDAEHFYPVFFPPGVETQDGGSSTSAGGYCAYHSAFGSGSNEIVYANMPYNALSGCSAGQSPNGNAGADTVIDSFSHELNEAITDPTQSGWYDSQGNEQGDMCGVYGAPLGSTNPSDPGHTEYNQVINGGKYYTQAEFSNVAFSKLGDGRGCALSEAQVQSATGGSAGSTSSNSGSGGSAGASGSKAQTAHGPVVIRVVNDATPTTLPANGKSTAEVSLGVANAQNQNVVGDPVHFSVGVRSGSGQCGTLSQTDKNTNSDGNADITYTASTSNVSCWVLGVEGKGGQTAQAVIYQGTTQKQSPTFTASYPTKVKAGGSTDFTIKATNPTSRPVFSTRPHFVIFPGDGTTKNVNASQVHLTYSTTGANGTTTGAKGAFSTVPLTGSTINGGAIQGYVGPLGGVTLAPDSTRTYTFRIALAPDVPVSHNKPLMAFETYLDQIDPADETGATLADTLAYQVKVPGETSTGGSLGIWAAAAAALALVIGGLLVWRTAKRRRQEPPAQAA